MRIARIVLGLALLVPCAAAQATDLVVVEARGIAMRSGQIVDSTKPLVLKQGQHVTLIGPTGATLKLDGPYEKAPDADQGQSVALGTMLAALVTQRQTRIGEVGTTRGLAPNALPEPWVLDASRAGIVCLQEGATAVFWRPDASREGELAIMPADRSWKAEARWPAGSDRITITTDVPIHEGASYLVSLDGNQSAMTVATVPAILSRDEMRVGWMASKGCESQAEALQRQQR
jgi:hypothetical protein